MGKFGMTLSEAKRSLPRDFPLLIQSYNIRRQEKEYFISLQAWQNQSVQSTVGTGKSIKPRYKNFTQFYNTNEQFNRAIGRLEDKEDGKVLTLADRNRLLNDHMGNKEERLRVNIKRKGSRNIALMNKVLNSK